MKKAGDPDNELTLIKLKEGETAEIVDVRGRRIAVKKLTDLGLTRGTKIKVLTKSLFGGPVMVEIRGSRLVLGRGLASNILVKLI